MNLCGKEELENIINILTQLLIKQEFADRQKGKCTYVKKSVVYKDLIDLLKEVKSDEM